MSPQEFAEIQQRIVLRWPHVDWDSRTAQGVLDQMLSDLAEHSGEQVAVAAEAYFREGHDWPPTAGQLIDKITDLAMDIPDWGGVALEIKRCMSYLDGRREQRLAKCHPMIGAFVEHVGWPALQGVGWPDNTTVDSQARRRWEQFAARARREASYEGLPPAGLRTLERISSEPRQIGEAVRKALPEAS